MPTAASGSSTRTAPVAANRLTSAALAAEAEAARFAKHGGAGVALRFGQFYGFDSGHTVQAIKPHWPVCLWSWALSRRTARRSRPTTQRRPWWRRLSAPSGVYNVVDDRPLPRAEYVDALAHALGVRPPPCSVALELPPTFRDVALAAAEPSGDHRGPGLAWGWPSSSPWRAHPQAGRVTNAGELQGQRHPVRAPSDLDHRRPPRESAGPMPDRSAAHDAPDQMNPDTLARELQRVPATAARHRLPDAGQRLGRRGHRRRGHGPLDARRPGKRFASRWRS